MYNVYLLKYAEKNPVKDFTTAGCEGYQLARMRSNQVFKC